MQVHRRAVSSWLFVGALLVLCGVLGVLQYRWIGEVSLAALARMQGNLQAALNRASVDFNTEIANAIHALVPLNVSPDPAAVERVALRNLEQWKKTERNPRLLRRLAVAAPVGGAVRLRMLDTAKGEFVSTGWPAEWSGLHDRLQTRLESGQPMMPMAANGMLFEMPLLVSRPSGFGRAETGWLVLELNQDYLREAVLPEVLQRDLETGDKQDYQVEVVARSEPEAVLYQSDPAAGRIAATADASVGLLDPVGPREMGRGRRGGGRGPAPGFGGGADPGFGRWQLYARHKAGSLEAAVAHLQMRNLAVTGGVLLLLIVTAGALVRSAARAASG
jgi:hypothetical protein